MHLLLLLLSKKLVKNKREATKQEIKRGTKILGHMLRMYLLANQIAFFGKITDWEIANKYQMELKENPVATFEEVTTRFNHVVGTLQNQLKANCFG